MNGEKKIKPYNVRLGVTADRELRAVAEFQGVAATALIRQWAEERLDVEVSRLRRAAEKLDRVDAREG